MGKKVSFVGVNPSILGMTHVIPGLSTKRTSDTIVFADNHVAVLSGVSPFKMYLPSILTIGGYSLTGRKVDIYYEYDRVDLVDPVQESQYSETFGIIVKGDVSWTVLSPGLYKTTRAEFEKLGIGRDMMAPSSLPSYNSIPYRYSTSMNRLLRGKTFHDYVQDMSLDVSEWKEYQVVSKEEMVKLSKGLEVHLHCCKFDNGTLIYYSRNVSKCWMDAKCNTSNCEGHVHVLRFVRNGTCYEAIQNYLVLESRFSKYHSILNLTKEMKTSDLRKYWSGQETFGNVEFEYRGLKLEDKLTLMEQGVLSGGFVVCKTS
jgi:hypothetical protein